MAKNDKGEKRQVRKARVVYGLPGDEAACREHCAEGLLVRLDKQVEGFTAIVNCRIDGDETVVPRVLIPNRNVIHIVHLELVEVDVAELPA